MPGDEVVRIVERGHAKFATERTEYQAISLVFRPGTCGSLKTETFIPNTTKPERTVIIFVIREVV